MPSYTPDSFRLITLIKCLKGHKSFHVEQRDADSMEIQNHSLAGSCGLWSPLGARLVKGGAVYQGHQKKCTGNIENQENVGLAGPVVTAAGCCQGVYAGTRLEPPRLSADFCLPTSTTRLQHSHTNIEEKVELSTDFCYALPNFLLELSPLNHI